MDYLTKNLEVLRANHPHVFETAKRSYSNERLNHYKSVVLDAKDETLNINKSVEAAKSANSLLLVVRGFDSAKLVIKIAAHVRQDILLFEPDVNWFVYKLTTGDFTQILSQPNFHLVVGTQGDTVTLMLRNYFESELSRIGYLNKITNIDNVAFRGANEFAPVFEQFDQALTGITKMLLELYKPNIEDGFRGLFNTVRNYPEYFSYPHLLSLRGLAADYVGVVVGTGPSLNKSLDYLKAIQDKVIIFSCDTAMKILLSHGITPDFVASIERDGALASLFENMPELPDTYFIGPALLVPEVFERYRGPKLRLTRNVGFERWFGDEGEDRFIGISPSHLSYWALAELGCKKIILVGQDCAYDPFTEDSHSSEAPKYVLDHGKESKKTGKWFKFFNAPGNSGKPILTNDYLSEFAHRFGGMIFKAGLETINAIPKDYGLPIPGANQEEPSAVFGLLKNLVTQKADFKKAIVAHKKNNFRLEFSKNQLIKTRDNLKRIAEQCLSKLNDVSLHNLYFEDRLLGVHNPKVQQQFMSKMEQGIGEIIGADDEFFHRDFMPLIGSVHVCVGIDLMNALHQDMDPSERVEKQTNLIRTWFETMHLWASRALYLLESENAKRWHYW